MVYPVLLARLFFAVLVAFVTYQTLIADPQPGGGLAIARWISETLLGGMVSHDKVAHFLAYGALGLTAFMAQGKVADKIWIAPLGLALYGGALEILQGMGGDRSAELSDAFANTVGAAAGFAGAYGVAAVLRWRAA